MKRHTAYEDSTLCGKKVVLTGMVVGAGGRLDIRIGDFDDGIFFSIPQELYKEANVTYNGKPVKAMKQP